MRRPLRILLKILAVLVGLLVLAGGFLWWKLRPRIEAIPAALADVGDLDRVARIRVPGGDGLPDLVLGELRGSTAYFVLESRESMQAKEGRELGRALDRWVYPEGVRGFSIGEAEGLGLLKWQIDKFVRFLRKESRLPLYMDYEGALLRGFKLPKGHTGVIVLGPDGAVRYRHTGKMEAADIEELRTILGAVEPPPGPLAPEFAVGPLSRAACAEKVCALIFLGRPIAKQEVPGIPGGASVENEAAWNDPALRLAGMLVEEELPAGRTLGLFIGDLADVPLAAGWSSAADSSAARAAFAIPAGETALVVIDAAGRIAVREVGLMPFWKAGNLGALLGLPEK